MRICRAFLPVLASVVLGACGGGTTTPPPADTTPPTLASGSPAGTLAAGTTSTTLSVTTSETATCRYATTAGTAYAAMTSTFSTTGGAAHSTTLPGLANGTTYNHYLRCQDTAGNANTSDYTVTFSVASATGDTTAPSTPANLSATAISSSQNNLAWTASTDNVGVTGYRVERCQGPGCTTFTQVATPTGITYSDTGLSAGTPYTYRVRAADAAGNTSAYSSTASATTQSSGSTATYSRVDPTTDITYLGAFRMPSIMGPGLTGYDARGFGLTFYPGGDGGKGSLFIVQGHVNVSSGYGTAEISIPTPVNSKNPNSLNRATLLQPMTNIIKTGTGMTDQFGDVVYMSKVGGQTTDKLYWTSYQYYGAAGDDYLSVGWSDLTFSSPNIQGPWHIGASGTSHINKTGKYAFEADHAWADLYLGGKYLLDGRLREAGGQGGSQGPTLYAIAPWQQGNPPASGANLPDITLLEYPSAAQTAATGVQTKFPNFAPNDACNDAVWVKTGDKHAVLMSGRKGTAANACYGTGTDCNDTCDNSKGYHSQPYSPLFVWYDVNDFAQVAQGQRTPDSVIPYSTWTPTANTWDTGSCANGYGGIAYDATNQKIYVVELYVDTDSAPIVHVFKVGG